MESLKKLIVDNKLVLFGLTLELCNDKQNIATEKIMFCVKNNDKKYALLFYKNTKKITDKKLKLIDSQQKINKEASDLGVYPEIHGITFVNDVGVFLLEDYVEGKTFTELKNDNELTLGHHLNALKSLLFLAKKGMYQMDDNGKNYIFDKKKNFFFIDNLSRLPEDITPWKIIRYALYASSNHSNGDDSLLFYKLVKIIRKIPESNDKKTFTNNLKDITETLDETEQKLFAKMIKIIKSYY